MSLDKLKEVRVRNKVRFDRVHCLCLKKIEKGDWVIIYGRSLDNKDNSMRKPLRCWFGQCTVIRVNDNATYHLLELDGTRLAIPIVGKRVKVFKKH